MNTLLKAISIILLASVGTISTMYFCQDCPKKEAKLKAKVQQEISRYIEQNPEVIFEQIAKTDNFANTIKNFTPSGSNEIKTAVEEYLNTHPEVFDNAVNNNLSHIIEEITPKINAKLAAPAQEQEAAQVAPQNDPNQKYKDQWEKLSQNNTAPYVGPKNAKVTVVEFFDFACGHCKSLAPVMAELMKRNPDVKFVFLPLYFMSEHSHYASSVSFAAFQKNKFLPVFEGIMTLPDMNQETINQILADEGLDVEEIKKMIENKTIRRGVQDVDALSQLLGVNGVPMLLINGEEFPGRSFEDLQNKINSYK